MTFEFLSGNFRFKGLAFLQVKNSRDDFLKCSHYMPLIRPEGKLLPCVIYCHGNRLVKVKRHSSHCDARKLLYISSYAASIWRSFIILLWLHIDFTFSRSCFGWFFGSGCRADASEAAIILLPSNITVFTLDFSGSGLSGGEHVTLGWNEVSRWLFYLGSSEK